MITRNRKGSLMSPDIIAFNLAGIVAFATVAILFLMLITE